MRQHWGIAKLDDLTESWWAVTLAGSPRVYAVDWYGWTR